MKRSAFVCLLLAGCAQYDGGNSYLGLLLALGTGTGSAASSSIASQRRIFLSAATHDGNFGSISAADAVCNSDANRPATTSTYKAFLSDAANRLACTSTFCATNGKLENVDWVLEANTTYYRADGVTPIFTTNAAAIATFNFTNSFTGTAATPWTGMRNTPNDWQGSTANRCNFWTDGTAGSQGGIGLANTAGSASIRNTTSSCAALLPLLCVEQP